jgi:hypothetical protein
MTLFTTTKDGRMTLDRIEVDGVDDIDLDDVEPNNDEAVRYETQGTAAAVFPQFPKLSITVTDEERRVAEHHLKANVHCTPSGPNQPEPEAVGTRATRPPSTDSRR